MATLLQDLKKRMMLAMKAGHVVEKEILRVAIGEVETAASRVATLDDEATLGILRKLLKSNEETMGLEVDVAKKATLAEENAVLKSLLPQSLGVDAIVDALAPLRDAIRGAGNDGQATGIAMKHLKAQGAVAGGKDVTEAVKKMRG
jgi:uncharacterized protein YqeY